MQLLLILFSVWFLYLCGWCLCIPSVWFVQLVFVVFLQCGLCSWCLRHSFSVVSVAGVCTEGMLHSFSVV